MNFQKISGFLRKNLIFYITGFLILLGMKSYYSMADCEGLRWILGPTARWVETLSGIPFVYEQGMGYANHSLRFLIAPSCSGVQFMIITVAMLLFSFVHEAADIRFSEYAGTDSKKALLIRIGKGFGWIALSLLLSYGLTVFVNGLRIIVAIYLPSFLEGIHPFSGFLTAERLHTMIGAVVYFAALLTIYRLAGLLFQAGSDMGKKQAPALLLRKCLSPLFWYLIIVLGVPFLNRAYQKNGIQFTEFALLVTLCCVSVLLLYGLGSIIRRQLRSRE